MTRRPLSRILAILLCLTLVLLQVPGAVFASGDPEPEAPESSPFVEETGPEISPDVDPGR